MWGDLWHFPFWADVWGTVASWFGAVGTVASVATAAFYYVKNQRREEKAQARHTAFAEMVGCEPDEVLSRRFHQIFHQAPALESLLSVLHAFANTVVELAHKDGSVVRALMSRSAAMRADDQFALAAFQDLTEQLWEEGR